MNIVLEPDIEQWIGQEARRFGIAPEAFVAQQLRDQRNMARQLATLPDEEAALLARINEGLPTTFWLRYRELIAKRQAETLINEEQTELIRLADQVEEKNAERAPYLIALARLRAVSLPETGTTIGSAPGVCVRMTEADRRLVADWLAHTPLQYRPMSYLQSPGYASL